MELDPFPFHTWYGPRGSKPIPSYTKPLCFAPREGYDQDPDHYPQLNPA